MFSFFKRFLGKNLDKQQRSFFLRSSFFSLLLQILAAAFAFLTSIAIAWVSRDEGFGIYSLVYTWISLLSVIAVFGIDDLYIKEIPTHINNQDPASIRGLLRWGFFQTLWISLLIGGIFAAIVYASGWNGISEYATFYYWALLSLPFFALLHLYQSALRAYKFVIWGQIGDKIIQPIAFLLFLLLTFLLFADISDEQVIVFRMLSFLVSALLCFLLFYRFAPRSIRHVPPTYNPDKWLKNSRYYMATTLLFAISTRVDIIFLGFFDVHPASIAHYNAALKFADIIQIPFMGIAAVVTPMFAKLQAEGQTAQLKSLYRLATRIVFALTFIGTALFALLGDWLLGWYGDNFRAGYYCLLILCIGRLLHAFIGPANFLLMILDQQKKLAYIMLFSTLSTIALHCICIPLWDIHGAAFAALGGALVFECGVAWLAYRSLKVRVGLV